MSVAGLCQVCQTANAERRCDRCGTLVCPDHHDDQRGVCVECVVDMGPSDGSGPSDRDEQRDDSDVDHYRF